MKEPIELLSSISKQEPSPLLYHRILKKINEREWNNLTKKEFIAIAVPSFCVLIITLFIVIKTNSTQTEVNSIARALHLNGNYALYK